MRRSPVYVRAAGMACPVGLTWSSSCAAMRAGLTRKSTSPYRDNDGREIVASYLREGIVEDALKDERWLQLLAYALEDIVRQVTQSVFERAPLLLVLPSSFDERPHVTRFISDALSKKIGSRLASDDIRVFSGVSDGNHVALEQGRALAHRGQPCIVAAAESMLCARTLLRLSEQHRLLVEGNADGIIPGEAAAAVLLTRDKSQSLAAICGLGLGEEPASFDNDVPLRADGLVAAARAALLEAGLRLHDIDFRVSDAAGESFYFKEQALFVSRLLRERRAEFPLWLPAESLGDTGVAGGLCGLLWAMASWAREYAPGPRAIGFAGSREGARTAVVVEQVR